MEFTNREQVNFLHKIGYTVEKITYHIFDFDSFDEEYDLPSEVLYIAYKGNRPIQDNNQCLKSFRRDIPSYVFENNRMEQIFDKEFKKRLFKIISHQSF